MEKGKREGRVRSFWLLPVAALLLAGCTATGPRPLEKEGEPSQHRVRSAKLKAVMHELNDLVYERLYSELERDRIRARYALTLAEGIKGMAGEIGKVRQELGLAPAEGREFDILARELEDHGEQLWQIGKRQEAEELDSVLNRMVDTCNACHARFRGDGKK